MELFQKLRCVKTASGKWQKRNFANWKQRLVLVAPTGMHWYETEDQSKAKHSTAFTQDTTVTMNPRADMFPDIKDTMGFHYLCVHFKRKGSEEAWLLRHGDRKVIAEFSRFINATLEELRRDCNWIRDSEPVLMKSLCSNRLAQIADLRQVATAALKSEKDDAAQAKDAGEQKDADRAETERLRREIDHCEGQIAVILDRAREKTRTGEAELAAAKRECELAQAELHAAQATLKAAEDRSDEVQDAQRKSNRRCRELQEQIDEYRAQRETSEEERRRVFGLWRKQEERLPPETFPAPPPPPGASAKKLPRGIAPLAFSPINSPFHLLTGYTPYVSGRDADPPRLLASPATDTAGMMVKKE